MIQRLRQAYIRSLHRDGWRPFLVGVTCSLLLRALVPVVLLGRLLRGKR